MEQLAPIPGTIGIVKYVIGNSFPSIEKNHLPAREILADGMPRFIMVQECRVSNVPDGLEEIQVCSRCGKSLTAYWAVILDRTLNKELVFGIECVEYVVGVNFARLKSEMKARMHEEAEEEFERECKVHAKDWAEVNKELFTYIQSQAPKSEFYDSILNQVMTKGSLSQTQKLIAELDMTRNREFPLVMDAKVTISGRVVKSKLAFSAYGMAVKLTVRDAQNVDYLVKIANGTQIAKTLNIKFDEHKEQVYNVPETLNVSGKIKWIHPDGGMAAINRPKLISAIKEAA